MAKIHHICVHYKNIKESLSFLTTAQKILSMDITLSVVDNSHDLPDTAKSFAQVFKPSKNLGFLGGAKFAFAQFESQNFDWVILSNTDLHFINPNFYHKLSEILQKIPSECALIAPSIISGRTQSESNPLYLNRPSKSKVASWNLVFSNYIYFCIYQLLAFLKDKIKSKYKSKTEMPLAVNTEIYAAHGSFLILRASAVRALNLFNQDNFLYGEEIQIAEKLLRSNLKSYFIPDLQLFHDEHGAVGVKNYLINRLLFSYRKEAIKQILKEMHITNQGLISRKLMR